MNSSIGTLGGYAAKFNSPSQSLGDFIEILLPGCFDAAIRDLAQKPVQAYWNHERNSPLGSTVNNTLRLRVDSVGLRYELDLPNSSVGSDVWESVKRRDTRYSSFGFRIAGANGERWTRRNGEPIREVSNVELIDVSPCPEPAFLSSTCECLYSWSAPTTPTWSAPTTTATPGAEPYESGRPRWGGDAARLERLGALEVKSHRWAAADAHADRGRRLRWHELNTPDDRWRDSIEMVRDRWRLVKAGH